VIPPELLKAEGFRHEPYYGAVGQT